MTVNFQNIPFQNIVKFGQRTMLDRPLFSTSWILGRFCNYKCSYCWPYARSDQPDHLSLEVYIKTVNEIKRQARENGFTEFHWSFSGGEPTAYKQLPDLIKHLDDGIQTPYQSVHMTTNLSPGSKWWGTWCKNTEMLQRRSITASYHAEHAREQEFGDKCLQLIYEQVHVTVNQVMVPAQFYELYDRCSRLHSRGINVTLKPQSDPTASSVVNGYTDDMINKMQTGFPQQAEGEEVYQIALYDADDTEYLFDQAERFNAFSFNKFQGWSCNSGYQSVIVRNNEVKRSYSCHDQPLGTLTDGFELFNSPVVCSTPSCVSSADSKIPKVKINRGL
jgi:pyruvate-formate lyase-activating enzyme